MSVICPNCEARFRDPPADIPLDRPLQCSKCEHEWLRAVHETPKRFFVDAPSVEPSFEDLLSDKTSAIETKLPVVIETGCDKAGDEITPILVDREQEDESSGRRSLLPVAGIAALGLLAAAVSMQEMVVGTMPQTQTLYDTAGLTKTESTLQISSVETQKGDKDGIKQLIVRGEILNQADHTVPVPPLKVTMRGDSNVRLYAWTVTAAKDQLNAGEKSGFTAIAHNYPGEAVDVEVEFLPAKKE